ncbi:MAG: VWA domain-containing protein, partial [Lachnospiraceae bacterium]|nr:VWA domain-containing protein [Lachnospiraceae bacterium]
MKTKTFRKVMGAVLTFALVVTGLKFGEIKAVAGDPVEGTAVAPVDYSVQTAENDDIFVTKSAIALGDDKVQIEFEIKDKSVTDGTQSKGDVVLVIDASGNQNKNDMYVSEKEDAKKVALELTKKGYKVGVVSFRSEAKKELLPTNTYSDIEAAINNIDCIANSPYHTNIQAGLHAADEMLGNQNRSSSSIILLSDGLTNQCYRPYSTQENVVTLYNVLQSGGGVTLAKNVTLASGFKYIKPIANASDGQLGSSYTQPGYIDSLERKYVFNNTFALVDDEYYYLNKEYQEGFNNTLSTYPTIKCRKVKLNANEKKPKEQNKGNNFTLVGDEIELTRWVYPAGLPNKGFYVNVMDTGFMTVSEAYLIKNKGTSIFTLTYPGFFDGKNNKIDTIEKKYLKNDNDEKIRFRRFVMVNVANSPEKGVGAYNWFINTNKEESLSTALESIIKKLEASRAKPVSEITLTDRLPSYLSFVGADADNVITRTDTINNGVTKYIFVTTLDREAMMAAYRANNSIGIVTDDTLWIDMNAGATVKYGDKTLTIPNPKLPFATWKVNASYYVEVPNANATDTECKVVTAPAVQLLETETYTINNVSGYDVSNPVKYETPQVIKSFSNGIEAVSAAGREEAPSIGSEIRFDGTHRTVNVSVLYDLKSYTVSFYNENGEGIIERLIPVTEPVIPVADAPVDPQPAEGQQEEGQQEEGQQDGEPQENGERVILTPIGEITIDP